MQTACARHPANLGPQGAAAPVRHTRRRLLRRRTEAGPTSDRFCANLRPGARQHSLGGRPHALRGTPHRTPRQNDACAEPCSVMAQ
jgi:hypothetical protein